MNAILESLAERESMTFVALFEGQQSRLVIIVTFLALLELIRIAAPYFPRRGVWAYSAHANIFPGE